MLTTPAALFEVFIELGRTCLHKLAQRGLIAARMTAICAAVHMSERGGIAAGFSPAFLENDADRMGRRRIREQALKLAKLRKFAVAAKLTEQLLQTMPERAPGASRVWLEMFHNGITGLAGTVLLRYDVTDAATIPPQVAGPAVDYQPVSECSDKLPTLSAGQSASHRIIELCAPSMACLSDIVIKTFGSILAAPRGAIEILRMMLVHPEYALARLLIAYGLQ